MIEQILNDLLSSVSGARAAIFLDGDGESIALAGDSSVDMRLVGAWKELQLDHIKAITGRLGLGGIHAVLFSKDDGNELVVPIAGEYCLLLFLSTFANLQDALAKLKEAIVRIEKDIE